MIKRLISLAFIACAFMSVAPQASAQAYGTWAHCGGIWRFGGCNGPTQSEYQQWQHQQQLIAMQRQQQLMQYPQQFAPQPMGMGSGLSNCALVGGLAGATLGSFANNHRPQAMILGGLLGGVAGSMVCTNSAGQRVTVPQQMPPQAMYQNPGVYNQGQGIIPMEQQVGGFETNNFANPGHLPRQAPMEPPVRGVFCNIDGVVTKEANNAACEAKARQKAEGLGPQTQLQPSAGSGAGTKVMSSSKAPVCGTGKTWGRLNWEGHPQHNTYACLPADAPRFTADD